MVMHFHETLGTNEELVPKKLEQWASEIGDKTFIFYGEANKSITYKRFNQLANSFANQLIDKGIQKGDRISLFLKNPLITTIAMFGIWKAGAVYCPINFNYKGKLLSHQLHDTKPKMLISERQMVPLLNEIVSELSPLPVILHDPKVNDHDYKEDLANVELDRTFSAISFTEFLKENLDNPDIEISYDDTANIIYTSGTTGPAKGVVQSYRWIHGYTYMFRVFNKQEDVIYNDLPMYHVGGAFALVARGAFLGCTVALWDKFSPTDFWKRIEISRASNAILLDVMIPWLMNQKPTENDRYNTLNRVHMQPLPKHHHEVAKRFGIDFVSAGFGQTESGNGFVGIIDELAKGEGTPKELYKGYTKEESIAIAEELNIPLKKGQEDLPKGYMGHTSPFYEGIILNERDEECSVGETGQLALRPRFPQVLFKEYFNAPSATLEVVKNLWFHTGDVGYKGEDNTFYFVDRMKDVIRHKGENISSYQIEDMINQHEHVEVCAAFPVPAAEGDEDDIVVYVVPQTDEIDMEALDEWIKQTMPKFMWPKFICSIPDLPRTATNKVEKYKLKAKFQIEQGV